MNKAKIQILDKDLANAETALRRAAKKAKAIAQQTHTPLVIYEKGKVIKKFIGVKREK